jgi:hypothetical protein
VGLLRLHTEELVCTVPAFPIVAGFQSPLYNGLINFFVTETSIGCVDLKHRPLKPEKLDGGNTYIRIGAGAKIYPDFYGRTFFGPTDAGYFLRWGAFAEITMIDSDMAGFNVGTWGMNFFAFPPPAGTEIYIGYEFSPYEWRREHDKIDYQIDNVNWRAIEDFDAAFGVPIEDMSNQAAVWVGETAPAVRATREQDDASYQIDNLSWRAIEDFDAAFGVLIEDMGNAPSGWTAEA